MFVFVVSHHEDPEAASRQNVIYDRRVQWKHTKMAFSMRPGILEISIRGITAISDKSQDRTRPTGYVRSIHHYSDFWKYSVWNRAACMLMILTRILYIFSIQSISKKCHEDIRSFPTRPAWLCLMSRFSCASQEVRWLPTDRDPIGRCWGVWRNLRFPAKLGFIAVEIFVMGKKLFRL